MLKWTRHYTYKRSKYNLMSRDKPELKQIAIDLIHPGEFQPRKHFDQNALVELAQSIKVAGLLQPIVVRPRAPGEYEIIAGERRWRAAQLAGFTEISALVKNYTNEQAAQASAIENLNRENLNPMEEALAYQRLVTDFNYLHEEVAAALGKSRTVVTNALRLLKLIPDVQQLLIQGRLSSGHGRVLAGLNAEEQRNLAGYCLSRNWSVRKLEQEAARLHAGVGGNRQQDPNMRALCVALSEHIGCPVSIQFQEQTGQMAINFQNLDILEGIFQRLGFSPQERI
jgi:ParB family chromosome partitioning protein